MKIGFKVDYEGGEVDLILLTNIKNRLDRAFWLTAALTTLTGLTYLNLGG